MGMPVTNENLISVQQLHVDRIKNADKPKSSRPRNISDPSVMPNSSKPILPRNSTAPELPPIGVQPCSPSYSSPSSLRQLGSPLELTVDSYKRTPRSPLSPTSTASSQEGSNLSARSPASGLNRSRTWAADLNGSQHGSGKLETLYETSAAANAVLVPGINQLAIIRERRLDAKETRLVPSAVPTPPPIDRHMNIKSTQTITAMPPPQASDIFTDNQLPPTVSTTPQLTANRLSQENLVKHRRVSQSSSMSSTHVTAVTKASSDTGYDTDDEKEHRIVEWLIDVKTSHTEQPPDVAELTTNEKRDTAIHIVYDGD